MYIGTAIYILQLRYVYRHRTLLYCNCDMYICKALYILQLRYVYRHRTLYIATAICLSAQHFIAICISSPHFRYVYGTALYIVRLRYVYLHSTLYIATAICISAQHFIYCDCDMYIYTALYILRLRYIYLHSTLYIATAICISAPHFAYIHAHRDLIAGAVYACACALSDAMAGTGPGQLSASQAVIGRCNRSIAGIQ